MQLIRKYNLEETNKDSETTHRIILPNENPRNVILKQSKKGEFWRYYTLKYKEKDRCHVGEKIPEDNSILFFDFSVSGKVKDDEGIKFQEKTNNLIYEMLMDTLNKLLKLIPQKKVCALTSAESKYDTHYRYYFPGCKCTLALMAEIYAEVELNTPENVVFDPNLKRFIPLYYSEDEEGKLYEIVKLYSKTGKDVHKNIADSLLKTFSVEEHYDGAYTADKVGKDTNKIIPYLLSLSYGKTLTEIKKEEKINEDSTNDIYNTRSLDFVVKMLDMIPAKEFVRMSIWKDIGRCIKKYTYGSKKGKLLWTKYTYECLKTIKDQPINNDKKKTSKNDIEDDIRNIIGVDNNSIEESINDFYLEFDSHLTVDTLEWYARKFNKEEYDSFYEVWEETMFTYSLSRVTRDIANLFYVMNRLKYKATSCDKKRWYFYNEKSHRWEYTSSASVLKLEMDEGFLFFYIKKQKEYEVLVEKEKNVNKKEEYKQKIDTIKEITKWLGEPGNKRKILEQLESKFKDEKFLDKIDDNMDYLGLGNCVLEVFDYEVRVEKKDSKGKKKEKEAKEPKKPKKINKGMILIRPGKPEDYIHSTSNICYDLHLSFNSETVRAVLKWLGQCYPNPELRMYMRKYYASVIKGGNPEKKAIVVLGRGDNGKTTILKTLKIILGPKLAMLPASSISNNKRNNSGNATTDINPVMNARLAVISEFSENDILNPAELKSITSGGDPRQIRRMFQEATEGVIQAKLISFTNICPVFSKIDQAGIERILIIPQVGKFSSNAPNSEADQKELNVYPKDIRFEKQLPKLAVAMLWLMVHDYPLYVEEGMDRKPQLSKRATDSYWYDNDNYAKFIKNNVKYSFKDGDMTERDDEKGISMRDMYQRFQKYHDMTRPSSSVPSMEFVEKELVKRMGINSNSTWWGVELIEMKEIKKGLKDKDGTKTFATVDSYNTDNSIYGKFSRLYEGNN